MKVLLEHGSDRNARLKTGATQRAHTPGEFTLGEGSTPMMRAAKNGDTAAIRLLLEHGADPNLRQKNGTTALMFASGLGYGTGTFANDYATTAELLESVKVLVAAGADINAVSDAGQTPLHFGATASDDIVKFLAANGAKLDIKDKAGRTPVEMALGIGLHGHAGGPPTVREGTANLLRQLMSAQTSVQ
jgi:ankyrin repeat protein